MTQLSTFAGILALATVVEALTEYLARPIVAAVYRALGLGPKPTQPRLIGEPDRDTLPALRYVAALVGVALCWAYRADLLALVGLDARYSLIGYLVTGLLLGRGANFINDFADRWLGVH